MLPFVTSDFFPMVCQHLNKWGLSISFDWDTEEDLEELYKAAPYLDIRKERDVIKQITEETKPRLDFYAKISHIIHNGKGYLFFDTEDEMDYFYSLTVGKDGPTPLNDYNGGFRVYAYTCNPKGQILTENC